MVVLTLAVIYCGRKEMKVTNAQMEERIKQEIPIGSSKAQVIAFVDKLNINSRKATSLGYIDGKPLGTDELTGQQDKVVGYLVAGIPKVGQDPSQFQVYHMRMIFYFGAGERLIDYRIETLGDS